MTARFEAKYDNGVSYYGGSWAPGAEIGLGLAGKITSGLRAALGRHIMFNLHGNELARIVGYIAQRWPELIHAAVSGMEQVDISRESNIMLRLGNRESAYDGSGAGKIIQDAVHAAYERHYKPDSQK